MSLLTHYLLSSPGQSLPTPATWSPEKSESHHVADQRVHVDWTPAMVSGGIFNLDYPEYGHLVRQQVPTKCPQSPGTASLTFMLQSQNWEKRRLGSTGWGQVESDSIVSEQKTKTKQELRTHGRRAPKTLVQTESSPASHSSSKHHPLDSWRA